MRLFLRSSLTFLTIVVFFQSDLYSFQEGFGKVYDKVSISEIHGITDERSGSTTVQIRDQIEILLNNPDSVELNDYSLFLYIDGQRLPTNRTMSVEDDRIVFILHETDTLKSLLFEYINSWGIHERKVRMSFGDKDGNHVHIEAPNITINFDPYYSIRSWIGKIIIVIVIVCFGFLVKRNSFLKADGSDKYSLSRTQMGWWTIIVICSYIALWSDSGILVELTPDTLILLGISSVTAAVAQTIDKNKNGTSPTPDPVPVVVDPTPAKVSTEKQNFFTNILSDGTGVSIQRFQSVIFTFFIGVFFVYKVIVDFEMPDLDPGILGLMGISSATYAGLKTNEKGADDTNPITPPGQQPPPAPAPVDNPPPAQ